MGKLGHGASPSSTVAFFVKLQFVLFMFCLHFSLDRPSNTSPFAGDAVNLRPEVNSSSALADCTIAAGCANRGTKIENKK
jgi:hypothetical protein